MTLKISLFDSDYVVRAKTDLDIKGKGNGFNKFFRDIGEELIPGKTAYLEIEGDDVGPLTLEVSKFELHIT